MISHRPTLLHLNFSRHGWEPGTVLQSPPSRKREAIFSKEFAIIEGRSGPRRG
jgi:hypothetical protein